MMSDKQRSDLEDQLMVDEYFSETSWRYGWY